MQKNSVELVETTGRSLEELAAAGRLASVFCRLARERFTGVVYVEHDDKGGVFTFRDGMPIYVEELASESAIGDQLVEQGLITARQHTEITAAAIGSATENEDLAFCEQSVQLGFLSQQQVDAELERRLRARLIQAIGFEECRIEIDADPDVVAAVPEYPLDLGPLIHTGVRTFFDEDAVRRVIGETDGLYVRLNVAPADAVQFFELGSDEEELVSRLDPQVPVDRTLRALAADPLDAWQLVCMLAIAELAELGRVPFVPASERSGLRSTHAIAPHPAGRAPSSGRLAVPREDEAQQASGTRQDVVGTGSRGRLPAVSEDYVPSSRPRMPAVSEQPGPRSQPRMPSAQPGNTRAASAARSGSMAAFPAADGYEFGEPARHAQPRPVGPGVSGTAASARAAQAQRSQATDVASGPVAARPAPAPVGEPISPTDRSRPRRKLSAALQRLDRELKDLRGSQPQHAAPAAPVAPAAPTPEPAAGAAAHAHVEQLLRMRAQQHFTQQKRGEPEAGNPAAEAYRLGQEALRENQFARAHELLRRASELAPNDANYQLQMRWAALRAGALDEDGISKLRTVLRDQITDDNHKKFAYYALGHLALFEKKDEAAEKFFRKAVELDKNNKDAERHLRIIELRRKSAAEDRGNKIFGIEIGKKKS